MEAKYPVNLLLAVFSDEMLMTIPEDIEESIRKVLVEFNEREKYVLLMRYREGKTLQQIADVYGVTRERIRQIETQALKRLKHPTHRLILRYGIKSFQACIKEEEQRNNEEKERSALLSSIVGLKNASAIIRYEKRHNSSSLQYLGLTARANNVLQSIGIDTIAQLCTLTESELLKAQNCGMTTLTEITKKLNDWGMELSQEILLPDEAQHLLEGRVKLGQAYIDWSKENIAAIKHYEEKYNTDSLDHLILSNRTSNALKRAGVDSISKLGSMTEDELYGLSGLGSSGFSEIKETLTSLGISLKPNAKKGPTKQIKYEINTLKRTQPVFRKRK